MSSCFRSWLLADLEPAYDDVGTGGTELLCGCGNNTVLLYDIERKRVVSYAAAHTDDINSVCFADSACQPHILVSASDDSFVKVCPAFTLIDYMFGLQYSVQVWDRRDMHSAGSSTPAPRMSRPCGVLPGHTEGITHITARGVCVLCLQVLHSDHNKSNFLLVWSCLVRRWCVRVNERQRSVREVVGFAEACRTDERSVYATRHVS